MDLPSTLRELQALCDLKGLTFKGKTKDALRTLLNSAVEVVDDSLDIDDDIIDIENKKLKDLKLICERRGLSKIGSKVELVRRIKSSTEKRDDGVPVLQWRKRGRKQREAREACTDDANTDDATVEVSVNSNDIQYKGLKKHELRQMCVMKNLPASGKISELVNRLLENDAVNKQIEADQDKLTPAQMCESCDDNFTKIYATPIAKWYCKECDQGIENCC